MAEIIDKKHFKIEAEFQKIVGIAIGAGFNFESRELGISIGIPFISVFIIFKF